MSWRPSADSSVTARNFSEFWKGVETVWDQICDLAPLPRDKFENIEGNYTVHRKGYKAFNADVAKRRLPAYLHDAELGAAEVDVFDVILNMKNFRSALVEGPRGAGKTSLFHYIESVSEKYITDFKLIFVIIDGLQLADRDTPDLDRIERDYTEVIKSEIERCADKLGDQHRDNLRKIAAKLSDDRTQTGIRESFRSLNEILDERKFKIVVVFDNLDHLPTTYVKIAIGLARQVAVVTKFSCFIALRGNIADSLFVAGDARAFFQFRIPLYAPAVVPWITGLGKKAARQVRDDLKVGNSPPLVSGKELHPAAIEDVFKRLGHVISTNHGHFRRPQDDVLEMLQAMAADDTRHLQLLVRRMLCDTRLPTGYLIGASETYEFHPVGALMEAGSSIFERNRYLPNLLCFENPHGNPDFLIFYRIMQLLDGSGNTLVSNLLFSMNILGYDKSSTLAAMQQLYGPLVIRCAEGDSFDESNPPRAVHLTEAGYYYRDHLLHNADYLVSVVMDVPLEHAAFKKLYEDDPQRVKDGRFFIARVRSLMEYTILVAERESAQVFRTLQKAPASAELRRIADVLRNGGLLTRSLIDGLSAISDRSGVTQDPHLRQLVADIGKLVGEHQSRIKRIQTRLSELVSRGRRQSIQLAKLPQQQDVRGLSVNFETSGDEIKAKATVAKSISDGVMFMSIYNSYSIINEKSAAQFIHAVPTVDAAPGSSTGSFTLPSSFIYSDAALPRIGVLELARSKSGVLFLAVNQKDDQVQLYLHKISNGARGEAIGPPVSISKLQNLSEKLIAGIEAKLLGGGVPYRFFKEAGTELAREVLDGVGANRLCSLAMSTQAIIIHSPEQGGIVPWEWLCPWQEGDEPVNPLAHYAYTIRWIGSQFDAATGIHYWAGPRPARKMITFGLSADAASPWRQQIPEEPDLIARQTTGMDVLHIVGHWDAEKEVIKVSRYGSTGELPPLEITRSTLRAFTLCDKGASIIFSVCEIGSLIHEKNMAVAIVELRSCAVWMPVTSIREDDATALDTRLATYLENISKEGRVECSVEDFFRNEKSQKPHVHVYIRYGL